MLGTVSITALSLIAMASSNAIINIMNASQSEEENNDEQIGLWTTSELGIRSEPNAPPSYAVATQTTPRVSRRSLVITTGEESPPPAYDEAVELTARRKRTSWIRARLQEYSIIMSD